MLRSVICLFQHGGPSQMDLFDPKPALSRHHGKRYPGSLEIHFDKQVGNLLASPFRFRPQGESGMVLSELIPHISGIADDLTLVRSMVTESVDHEAALRLIHTGKILAGRPTWGSWVVYALGARTGTCRRTWCCRTRGACRWTGLELVERVAAGDRSGNSVSIGGDAGAQPQDARRRDGRGSQMRAAVSERAQSAHQKRHPGNTELEARIANFEIAAAMQTAVPEALITRRNQRRPSECTDWTTR